MSWHINTHDITGVSSFICATKVWEAAQPWRNQHTSWRSLAGRRMFHKRIVRLSDARGYDCVLYNIAIVSYYADGSVALRCYDSVSTQAFAWKVKPDGCSPVSSQGRMFWQVRTDKGARFYRQGTEALMLVPTALGNWQLSEPAEPQHELVNDRIKRAAVRKQIKPYALWHAAVSRLQGRPFEQHWQIVEPGAALNMLPKLGSPECYPGIARIATPVALTDALYRATGAVYRAPVPPNRLPRNYA